MEPLGGPAAGPKAPAPADTAGPRRPRGGLLRQRDFRLLWAGETVSNAGNAMAAFGVPLLAVQVLRASTFAVSVLYAAAYLPWLLIGLPAGAWVDRLPTRRLMIGSDLASAALFASLPAAAWLGLLTTAQLLAVALLAGGVNVLFSTSYQVYLPALTGPADVLEGNAKMLGSMQVATISGRSLAGLAAQAIGDAAALLFNAASFLVSAACLLAIRRPSPPLPQAHPPELPATSVRAEMAAGLRWVAADRLMRRITGYAAAANLCYAGSSAITVVFLVRVIGLSGAAAGLLMATSGFGGIAGALLARPAARRLGTARALLLFELGAACLSLLIPLTGPGLRAAWYIAGAATTSAGLAGGNIIVGSFRQSYAPRAMLGRVVATQRFVSFSAVPLGGLLAGALGTALGVRATLWILCAGYALSGTLLLTSGILGRRDLPGPAPAASPAAEPAA